MYDIRRHQGARQVRLEELMDKHKGKIDIEIAKEIIADHYDVYLLKEDNPCSRTVCSHYDLDAREYMSAAGRPKPFAAHGVVDGFVMDSELTKKMAFVGRFGNSCGIPFDKNKFCDKHIQWNVFRPYLNDRPTQPWSEFSISDDYSEENEKKEKKKGGKSKRLLTKKNKTKKNK
jgi:hypothetical protein